MDNELTKDAEYLLCSLYQHYKEQRKKRVDKYSAKCVGASTDIQKNLMPEWLPEDVDETCRELDRAGFAEILYSDDIAAEVMLSDKAIIYMENRFKNGVSEVLDFMTQIKSVLF